MIRYPISQAELERRIEEQRPGWLRRGREAAAALPGRPASKDFSPLWSEIKQVYIDLQHSKCCFCEKPLEGAIEQDVEHFRPKAEVKPWPVPRPLQSAGISPPVGLAASPQPGYAWLAYHPLNYAIACKTCNSTLKKNQFPIAGTRGAAGTEPAGLQEELPLLIYPLGELDEPAQDLMGFVGLSPVPRVDRGHRRHRALVTIALFQLDRRPPLLKLRAYLLSLLFSELELLDKANSDAERSSHQTVVENLLRPQTPFSNCLNCFSELYRVDLARARELAGECRRYVGTMSLRAIAPRRTRSGPAARKKPRRGE